LIENRPESGALVFRLNERNRTVALGHDAAGKVLVIAQERR
jgi:hypothetical protein